MANKTYAQFYEIIRQIPEGQVATYGQIAVLAGLPGRARQVGYALNVIPDETIPWHRVINAQGKISKRADPVYEEIQQQLLESEGVHFDERSSISLSTFQWKPQL